MSTLKNSAGKCVRAEKVGEKQRVAEGREHRRIKLSLHLPSVTSDASPSPCCRMTQPATASRQGFHR